MTLEELSSKNTILYWRWLKGRFGKQNTLEMLQNEIDTLKCIRNKMKVDTP